MTHKVHSALERYRLLYLDEPDNKGGDRSELITASNDAEALKLAYKRIDNFRGIPIEIWAESRLVGRIDPPCWWSGMARS